MSKEIDQKRKLELRQYNSKEPLALIHMGIDLGSHNNLKRSIYYMGAQRVNTKSAGWKYELINMGFKTFEHCTLSQFFGFLKGHRSDTTPAQLNELIAKIAQREAKETKDKITKSMQQLQDNQTHKQELLSQQLQIKKLQTTIGVYNFIM